MELGDFLDKLDNVRTQTSGYSARCPAHDDHVSSLMVDKGRDGGIVVKCHAGCDTASIVETLGLRMMDLKGQPTCTARYEYVDLRGNVLYTIERWSNPKTFRARPGLPDPAQRILYQLGAIQHARASGRTVYVVEGEKDVDTLLARGLLATTNVGGAGKWLSQYAEALVDCHVVVIADNDAPGRAHARAVAESLAKTAASVSAVVVDAGFGKDVSELLANGYELDKLVPLPAVEPIGIVRASDVKPRSVHWAWPSYFPLGKLSIVEGDPGDGKSVLTVDLAARWSSGLVMPDGLNGFGPTPVIMVSAEDDPEDTIVPRLMAAGARLIDVHLIHHGATPELPFEFETGLPIVEHHMREHGARVVIFDPLTAFLGERVDSHNDASTRRALYPLKALASRTGAAIIAVRHLNKGGAGKALYRGGGSIAFTGAARATLLVAQDPRDPHVKVLASVKANLSARPPSLRYAIEVTTDGVPFVRWLGASELTAQQALDGPAPDTTDEDEERASKRRERRYAGEWLAELLDDVEPMLWADIVAAGKIDGFTEISLRRARSDVGLVKARGSDRNAVLWHLPSPESFAHLLTSGEPQSETISNLVSTDMSGGTKGVEPSIPNPAILQFAIPGNGASEQTTTFDSALPGETTFAQLLAHMPDEQTIEQTTSEQTKPPTDSDGGTLVAWLDSLPLECQVCHFAGIGVARYRQPWWVVRCADHNPIDYHADEVTW